MLHKTYCLANLDSDEFEDAMTEVFGRQLDSELLSQLALAFSTIIRLGKDWDAFQKASPKIFGRSLSTYETGLLFVVYSHCTTASPLYTCYWSRSPNTYVLGGLLLDEWCGRFARIYQRQILGFIM